MEQNGLTNGSIHPKSVLTISLSKHITGEPFSKVLDKEWSSKTSPAVRSRFTNVGFDVDPTNVHKMLNDLRQTIQKQHWDGLLLGWCLRGYPERTEMFEQVVGVCVGEMRGMNGTKLIFNTGPTNLVEPILRDFGAE